MIKIIKKYLLILYSRLFRKLQLIDDAESDLDLRTPPSNHFEKLLGKLKDHNSIRVNKQWRLIFNWNNSSGEASDIYLDNHDYN
jgi:toxin HigB-1